MNRGSLWQFWKTCDIKNYDWHASFIKNNGTDLFWVSFCYVLLCGIRLSSICNGSGRLCFFFWQIMEMKIHNCVNNHFQYGNILCINELLLKFYLLYNIKYSDNFQNEFLMNSAVKKSVNFSYSRPSTKRSDKPMTLSVDDKWRILRLQ